MNKKKKFGFLNLISIYYKRYWFSWMMLCIFTLLLSGITIAIPKLTNILFNELSKNIYKKPPIPYVTILYWAIGFGIAMLMRAIFIFSQSFFGGRIARKIEIDIRLKVLNHLLDLDMHYYHNKKIGNTLTKIISDTQILGDQTYQLPNNFLSATFTFLGSVIILFTLTNDVPSGKPGHSIPMNQTVYELAGIVLGTALGVTIITIMMFSILRKKILKQRKVITDINGDITDRINSIKLIKTTGTIKYEKNRFNNIHKKYFITSINAVKFQSAIFAIAITGLTSMNIVALLAGIVYVNHGMLNPTIMVSFTMSINSLIMPILTVVRMLSNLASASTSAIRIQEIMEAKSKININEDKKYIENINGNIVFKAVDFKYGKDEPLIIKNFNFEFKNNKSYALVGESGVGKSTISQLLLRLYDPIKGKILIDNKHDLKEINLKSYLDVVGYVEQDPTILFGNFYDNIKYGNFNATKEQVIEAAKKANIYDFIVSLPNKFDTILGERGFILSGGQKQRVVIARMFLKNPKILILDEATSSLDNIIEKEIQKELDKLMKNRTTIIIAHRLSTIKNTDKILVLEKNTGIVQIGSFNELKDKPGRFNLLYKAGLME